MNVRLSPTKILTGLLLIASLTATSPAWATTCWVDAAGNMVSATSDPNAGPQNTTAALSCPDDGRQVWDFGTETWGPPPPPPTDAEIIDQTWQDNPLIRALIKREARRGNKTVQQILDELKAELP